jgi:predicted nucleic acid-binding protein
LILVDTSVWVDHLRSGVPVLANLLQEGAVLIHPGVIGEIACGTPPARERTLADMAALQTAKTASVQELMVFVERERLYGAGCGLVDLALLASVRITPGARLWTLDKRLASLASRFRVCFAPPVH